MAPPDAPAVPPGEALTGVAVAGADVAVWARNREKSAAAVETLIDFARWTHGKTIRYNILAEVAIAK